MCLHPQCLAARTAERADLPLVGRARIQELLLSTINRATAAATSVAAALARNHSLASLPKEPEIT